MHSYPAPERIPEGKLYVCRNEVIITRVQEQDHATPPPSQIQYPVQTCVGDALFIPLLDPNHLLSTTVILSRIFWKILKYTFMPYSAGS